MSARLGVLVCALIVTGCKSSSRTAATPAGGARVADAPQPIASLAIWPERWATITALPQLSVLGGEVPSSFWAAAQEAAGVVGLGALALPPPGLEASGPITVEVHRPRATFETVGLATAKRAQLAPDDRVGLRVRVTLPAQDAAALAAALETAIGGREPARRPVLRVVRGDRAVALDVFPEDDVPAQLATSPAAIALPFDSGHDSAGRAALRLEGLADLGATSGMLKVMSALASFDGDVLPAILSAGTSEVLTAYLLADPASSASEALFVDVPLSGGPQVAFAPTEPGKAALTAGGLAPGKTLAVQSVRWPDAIAASPRSPLFAADAGTDDVARSFHECGGMCFAWVGMGNALGLASMMGGAELAALEKAALQAFPSGELTWTSDGLVFLHPPGARPAGWKRVATGAVAHGAAEARYRKALLAVRVALRDADPTYSADAATRAADADAALDGAASCVTADPAIAARHRALREMIAAIRALPRGERPAPPRFEDDDPPPPEEDDAP